MTAISPGWPSLPRAGAWPASQAYVHLVTQMMGKLRLALSPSQPEWLHTSLALSSRGLTTGALPWGDRSVEVALDIVDGALDVLASDGSKRRISLSPARPIADIWAEYRGALDGLGVDARMSDKPQELEDATRFSLDRRERSYDPHVGGVVVRDPDGDPQRVRRVALAVLRSLGHRVLVGRLRHHGHGLQWSSRDASRRAPTTSCATTSTRSP